MQAAHASRGRFLWCARRRRSGEEPVIAPRRIHALANVFVDLHLQVRTEFLLQVLFQAAFAQQAAEALKEHPQLRHDISPDGFMNLAMISEIRSQFSASAASCFWPARVMA